MYTFVTAQRMEQLLDSLLGYEVPFYGSGRSGVEFIIREGGPPVCLDYWSKLLV
jgi:hypothetical protein